MLSLEVKGLTFAHPAASPIFENAEVRIPKGVLGVLSGPNGVGKSTFLDLIVGLVQPQEGQIQFFGRQYNQGWIRPHQIAQIEPGVARSFQVPRAVPDLTLLDNVLIGKAPTSFMQWGRQLILPGETSRNHEHQLQDALEVLGLFGLSGKSQQLAGTLSYGEMRLLELARILFKKPGMVLLDEPFANLNRSMTITLSRILQEFVDSGATALIVEHGYEKHLKKIDKIIDIRDKKLTIKT